MHAARGRRGSYGEGFEGIMTGHELMTSAVCKRHSYPPYERKHQMLEVLVCMETAHGAEQMRCQCAESWHATRPHRARQNVVHVQHSCRGDCDAREDCVSERSKPWYTGHGVCVSVSAASRCAEAHAPAQVVQVRNHGLRAVVQGFAVFKARGVECLQRFVKLHVNFIMKIHSVSSCGPARIKNPKCMLARLKGNSKNECSTANANRTQNPQSRRLCECPRLITQSHNPISPAIHTTQFP
jgi:hypothetical protein